MDPLERYRVSLLDCGTLKGSPGRRGAIDHAGRGRIEPLRTLGMARRAMKGHRFMREQQDAWGRAHPVSAGSGA
jgi:hypothetical protein